MNDQQALLAFPALAVLVLLSSMQVSHLYTTREELMGLSPNNRGARSSPRESSLGCWNSEMPIPWKDDMTVVANGL